MKEGNIIDEIQALLASVDANEITLAPQSAVPDIVPRDGNPHWYTCQVMFDSKGRFLVALPLIYEGKAMTFLKGSKEDEVRTLGFKNQEAQKNFEKTFVTLSERVSAGHFEEVLRDLKNLGLTKNGEI